MLLADSPIDLPTGPILITLGLIAIGVASVSIKGLSFELEPSQRWITRIVGGVVVATGLYLVLIDSNGTAADSPNTTTTTVTPTLQADEVVIDHPGTDEIVSVTCDEPDSCWVPASGRVGEGTGNDVHPYLLVAYADGTSDPEYYVQYDSTFPTETRWAAHAYVEDTNPGDVLLMQAVLVRGEIAPPPDDSGLLWDTAKNEQGLDVVDDSDIVQVSVD